MGQLIEFEGKKYDFPDDASGGEISDALERGSQKTLFSLEGMKSTLRSVGPSLARGVLGSQLAGLEEVQNARNARAAQGDFTPAPDEEAVQSEIALKRKAIQEADAELAKILGTPSKPLEIAQGVVGSVAQNAPGVAAAVATRNVGTAAAAVPLIQAGEMTKGQEYATARVGKKAEIEPALQHANVAGATEAGFELLPTAWLIKNLGKTGSIEFVAKYIGRELMTELPTTAVQKISERIFIEPNKPLGDFMVDLGKELVDTALITPFAAGMTGGMAHLQARVGAPSGKIDLPKIDALDLTKPGEDKGTINPIIPPQEFSQPSPPIEPTQKEKLEAAAEAIDPDLISVDDLLKAQDVVKKHEEQKLAPKTPENEAAWMPLQMAPNAEEDPGATDLGASKKKAANAANYPNPNTGDRLDRKFLFGPEGTLGLTPRQVEMKPGTYTLGEPTDDRGVDFLKAIHDTYEEWRQKWTPNSTLVISNEALFSGTSLGWHKPLGPNMHLIVPPVLRNPKMGLDSFNKNDQAGAFFTASHEFGHALTIDRLYATMAPEIAAQVYTSSIKGLVPEQLLQGLKPEEQALIREFNAVKQRILDKSMTAEEFVNTWFSPAKLGRSTLLKNLGVAPTDNAMEVMKAIARQTRQTKMDKTKATNEATKQALEQFLSLDEYLSEQLPRHLFDTKADQQTPLGKFFKGALDSLRNFFASLKGKDGGPVVIKPGVAFAEWLDSLTQVTKVIAKNEVIAQAKKAGTKPAKKVAAAPAKKTAKAKPKVEKVQHNVETDTDEARADMGRKLVVDLIRSKVIEVNSSEQKELLQMIKRKDWDEFKDTMQQYGKKLVKFELSAIPEEDRKVIEPLSVLRSGISEEMAKDPGVMANAIASWKEKQFRSPYFKAWFGDWENSAKEASKIRRGAELVLKGRVGNYTLIPFESTGQPIAEDISPSSEYGLEPLVVFHSTRGIIKGQTKQENTFEKFSKGDLGFHFGTVRAAHVRANHGMPYTAMTETQNILDTWGSDLARAHIRNNSQLEGTYIIPAVLNIRNPLYVGEETVTMWENPKAMVSYLADRNILSAEQKTEVLLKLTEFAQQWYDKNKNVFITDVYGYFGPVRQMLVRMGYDGMVYDNSAEGDLSFVAFHPNQVKSLLGSRTYSRSDNLHMELDLDASKPSQLGVRKLWDGLKNFTTDFPRMRRFLRGMTSATYHVLELQQLAHINPDVEELSLMAFFNSEYNRFKSRLQAAADDVLNRWEKFGKENVSKIQKFLQAEVDSKTLWFDVVKTTVSRDGKPVAWYRFAPNATTAEKAKAMGIDEDLIAFVLQIKNTLLDQLNEAERTLSGLLLKRHINNPDVYAASIVALKRHIHELRKSPFFPEGRFGNRVLIIEKQKATGPGYDIVWREHFEDPVKWEEAWKRAEARRAPDERIKKEKLSDQTYVLMGLPTDFIDAAASELGLSDEQLEVLLTILQPVKRERALSAYDQQRLGIKGYSTDSMRSFANFTWHNSNLLAKLTYRAEFNSTIRAVGMKLREAKTSNDPESVAQVERLTHIKTFMEKTRDYIMAPPNEAQQLRALVSITYLGLNIKTALLNTYGLITTWSDLTSRLGQIEGNKLFLKASLDTFKSLKLTDLNDRRQGNYLKPEAQKALDQAIEEGVLSQSYAYHLAGMANGGNLQRLNFYRAGGQILQGSIDAAMYVFRLTELSTRRASFLAEFEATGKEPNLKSLGQPLSFDERYQLAVARTSKLQNDYSLGNRVPFMRGFKVDKGNPLGKLVEPVIPLATVFMSFMQHMAFHTYGGYELGERRIAKQIGETPRTIWGGYTMKIWLVTLLLAGYEGLPGAESLLDLLEAAWRKWGGAKPIRQQLREMVQELEVDPHLASRGLGYNFGGFDISRSVGFGRMVPGTDALAHPRDSNAEQLGTLILDMAGPTGGMIKFGLDMFSSDKPRSEVMQKLPGGIGNIYTAYRWSQDGVLAPSRGMITRDPATGELRDLDATEIFGKALGFNPTIVSQSKAIRFEQYDRQVYWQTRRKVLMNDLWSARDQKDREAEADVKKAITEYNLSVPAEYKSLRLNGMDMLKSMQAHQRQKRADEQGTSTQLKYRPLYEDISESHGRP